MGTSEDGDMKHLGKLDVVDVLAKSTNQTRIFAPLNPSADGFA
jgi:hypothetical protein